MRIFLVIAFLLATTALADDDNNRRQRDPRSVLIYKFIKNVGETAAASFIDVFRAHATAWGILKPVHFTDLDTDFAFFQQKTGIDVQAGFQVGPGIYADPLGKWIYIPFEVESDQLLDKVVADTAEEDDNKKVRVVIDAGNMLIFQQDGVFAGGEWAGKKYYKNGGLISEYVAMINNVTRSEWGLPKNHVLYRCRTALEPAIQVLNVFDQLNSIIVKSCVDVVGGAKSTAIVTNVYTVTSNTTRDERKTHAWVWEA